MPEQHYTVSGDRQYRNLWFLGFPKYRVGRDGSVWSKCKGRWGTAGEWKLKKLTTFDKTGRKVVLLWHDNCSKLFLVHRLVLFAFVGPCPEGMEACHNDGNPANNRLENLRWDTDKANQADRIKHGTNMPGEKHPMSKLTNEIVLKIKRSKLTHAALGRQMGMSGDRIRAVRKGWKHLNHLV